MKIITIIVLAFFLIGFTEFNSNQQKHLPVYISMLDTANLPADLFLYLKASFGNRKVKILSKKETEELIRAEIYSVTESYYKSGGDLANYDQQKNYQATHMMRIANSLQLSIRIDSEGIIIDTVKWYNRTLPMNITTMGKPKWNYMKLNSTNAKTLLQMSQSIVDSIIASNVLVKE